MTTMERFRKKMLKVETSLKEIFCRSLHHEISIREGCVLFVDDRPEQATVIEGLIKESGENIPVVCVQTVHDAQKHIECHFDEIKVAVVDLELKGNDNGMDLIDWIDQEYPDIPIIVSTGHAEYTGDIEAQYPAVQVFIKGTTHIEQYAQALGICTKDVETKIPDDDSVTIPKNE